MLIWIIVTILITPWFWAHPVPTNMFKLDLRSEVQQARNTVTWERGKVEPSRLNTYFLNWPVEVVNKRLSVVMENLDIGNYFFAGHPRERVGVEERQKFFFFQFVLFIIGFTSPHLKKYKNFLIIYSGVAILAVFVFQWRSFEQTIPLAIPFVVLMALGLKQVFAWQKKWMILFLTFSLLEIAAFGTFYVKGILK
ncbi:hypothetical protein A2985_04110 [Candidatus Woesebacteria bacterium RIFCSPLOWO2_01_FULL_43_11]|uniref:Uncharacterized protein n=1 Tax=Candidatus Woesebacteria bacterium RBG_16_42_24 TaxID=1802485 RepID=A0A1F7XKU3_9BACT|nr:MAG: hypothetical protein A2V97_01015 [Candidatus Woesebacteria bacterium RBG_16_42_24]OGM68177.1 MAG: hypothetical protein A2985_04110 [Candidatus Woesebacteria bacterium RIFCSPLOWO2_01_FULL_43_11]